MNFNNINYSGLQNVFTKAITSMVESSACTVPCTLEYGVTKYEDCSNCVYDPIGRKSSNVYQDGGPVPFPFSTICPMCNGEGKKSVVSTEGINLLVVYDPKDFIGWDKTVNKPDGYIQTMAKINATPKLQRAKSITVATDIDNYFTRKYERAGEPFPCGFGNNAFIVCNWRRL